MNKELLSKIQNIDKTKTVQIFASSKIRSWCPYLLNIIIQCFPRYKIVKNTALIHNVDIIITHIKHNIEYFSEKAVNIIISGENYTSTYKYDISISTLKHFNSHFNIYLPFMYMSLKEHTLSIEPTDYIKNKTKFCAYMYSYDNQHRVHYFNLFNNYKPVNALGKSCNNTEITSFRNKYDQNMTYLDEAVELYTDYKFVLAIENRMEDGYITEKIINPLISNCIPVYWGSDKIFDFINKDRFIYALDYDDTNLMNKIKEIDENENMFNEIIRQPIYCKDKTPESVFICFNQQIGELFRIHST